MELHSGVNLANLTLTNLNPSAEARHVIINLATRTCTFDNKKEVELQHLLEASDFDHPLLTERFIPAPDYEFHYEYNDVDSLIYAAIYVYSTLIHVDKPLACKFKITPSPAFQRAKFEKNIYFSMNSHEAAQDSIRITQLEAFVSEMCDFKFEFSEDTMIDDQITIHDLPGSVNGDRLYQSDPEIVELLKAPKDFSRYELRYINPDIKLGAFARVAISKGDIIGVYTGKKAVHIDTPLNYTYVDGLDALGLLLDARPYGNITRFINHAPSVAVDQQSVSSFAFLAPNIQVIDHYLNGIKMVVYVAKREILPGEQLLVDYGVEFFKGDNMSRFETQGQVVSSKKKHFLNIKEQELTHKRLMATHGVSKAQTFMLKRMFSLVIVIVISMSLLSYFL